jgi:RNase H-fold protein (predicted Holliday junction resolvase)
MANEDYKFPDELDDEIEVEVDEGEDIEIIDDTPEEDRNIRPLPKHLVDELETDDESEEFSKRVKNKFQQYKKVYHDERRNKEAAQREQEAAIEFAKKVIEENKKLKALLTTGEEELINTYKTAAELELDSAKRNYKEAYDSGDTDAIIEANNELIKANNKLDKTNDFRPNIPNTELQYPEVAKPPQVDPKVAQWVAENPWYVDPSKKAMAKFALAVHDDLIETHGPKYVGSKEYFKSINKEVQRRFPEEFESETTSTKPTLVAPVRRSTVQAKPKLSATQYSVAKKLGLTAEQYLAEVTKLEALNG